MKEAKIEIPKGHRFIIQIYFKKAIGSKTFLSKENFQQNINRMKNCVKEDDNGKEVKLKLIDTDTKHTKNINIKVSKSMTIEKIKEQLVTCDNSSKTYKLMEEEGKYRIVIDNIQTRMKDKRAFTMIFNGPIESCVIVTQNLLQRIIKEQEDKDIVFTNDDKKAHTHYVTIHKCGSREIYKKLVSKTFSIKFTNYSSGEIINLIRKKITRR